MLVMAFYMVDSSVRFAVGPWMGSQDIFAFVVLGFRLAWWLVCFCEIGWKIQHWFLNSVTCFWSQLLVYEIPWIEAIY